MNKLVLPRKPWRARSATIVELTKLFAPKNRHIVSWAPSQTGLLLLFSFICLFSPESGEFIQCFFLYLCVYFGGYGHPFEIIFSRVRVFLRNRGFSVESEFRVLFRFLLVAGRLGFGFSRLTQRGSSVSLFPVTGYRLREGGIFPTESNYRSSCLHSLSWFPVFWLRQNWTGLMNELGTFGVLVLRSSSEREVYITVHGHRPLFFSFTVDWEEWQQRAWSPSR